MDKQAALAAVKQFEDDVICLTHSTGKIIESGDMYDLVEAICKMTTKLIEIISQ